MSKSSWDLPERLRQGGGRPVERRLLDAVAQERPSRELSERMAASLGVSLPAELPLGDLAPGPSSPVASGVASSRGVLTWLSGVAVVGATASALLMSGRASPPPPTKALDVQSVASAQAVPVASAAEAASVRADVVETARPGAANSAPRRSVESTDLQGQIALIGTARDAIAAGSSGEALALVKRYRTTYPRGSFAPEATALQIEGLLQLGRTAEARALGERFVKAHAGSLLAARVARLCDIAKPKSEAAPLARSPRPR